MRDDSRGVELPSRPSGFQVLEWPRQLLAVAIRRIREGFGGRHVGLAASPALPRKIGHRGRDKVRGEYDLGVKVDRVVAVYRHAIQRRVPGEVRWRATVS